MTITMAPVSPLPLYKYIASAVFMACTLLVAYIWSSRATLVKGYELVLGPKDGVSPSQAEKAFSERALSILRSGVQKVLPILPCFALGEDSSNEP